MAIIRGSVFDVSELLRAAGDTGPFEPVDTILGDGRMGVELDKLGARGVVGAGTLSRGRGPLDRLSWVPLPAVGPLELPPDLLSGLGPCERKAEGAVDDGVFGPLDVVGDERVDGCPAGELYKSDSSTHCKCIINDFVEHVI